jgi:outer membrane protein
MLRYLTTLTALAVPIALLMHPVRCDGNELERLYELALSHDATLQAATFERAADIEVRPQALSALLPQLGASASANRERAGFEAEPVTIGNSLGADCALAAGVGSMQRCYGNAQQLELTLSQTLWSYEAYSRLKEADFQAAAAEASFRGAQQSLVLRVAQAYFAILAASDQLATNLAEREAFATLLKQAQVREQTGVGPRSDAQQAQAFYDATDETVIDARNALDDANLALTEIVGTHDENIVPLRENIPLASPEPASVSDWVASARQDNLDVRAAELKVEAAARDIGAQRGRALPTFSLIGSSSRLAQDEALGGNQSLDSVGVAFNWPLFQGGAVASAVRQSRALYRQSQALFDGAQRDAERLARAAYRGVVSGIERIAAAQRAVESGSNAVEASRRNVEFGTGTEFDLLNAQNNYYAARRAFAQARYDYLTNLLTLKQQAGRLGQRDLAAVDALLVDRGT